MSVDFDVIIIGAGAAGIAAAIEIQKRSQSFIIIEGRDRIGGRICTNRTTFSPYPIDLGASWIHHFNISNPLYSHYQKCKNDEYNNFDDNEDDEQLVYLDYNGEQLPTHAESQAKDIHIQLVKRLEEFAADNKMPDDRSIEDVIKPHYDRLVKPYEQTGRLLNNFLADTEAYEATDFKYLSAKQWQDIYQESICEKWVAFGFETIVQEMVKQYRLPIQLTTVVTHIDTSDSNHIAIKTSTGTSPTFCRRLILTTSLGCLKRETIIFEPPLPDWKRQAISNMGFGLMNKLILQFTECFWGSKEKIVLHTCAEQRVYTFETLCLPSPMNILIIFIIGTHAYELEQLSDNELLEYTMTFLKRTFPHIIVPDPIRYNFTRWSQDPFAYGAYSNYAVHSSRHTIELLARETADERVHWAGEHAHVYDGTQEYGC